MKYKRQSLQSKSKKPKADFIDRNDKSDHPLASIIKTKQRERERVQLQISSKKESKHLIKTAFIKEIVFVIKTFPPKNNSMTTWPY